MYLLNMKYILFLCTYVLFECQALKRTQFPFEFRIPNLTKCTIPHDHSLFFLPDNNNLSCLSFSFCALNLVSKLRLVSKKAFRCARSVRYFVYNPIQLTHRYKRPMENTFQMAWKDKVLRLENMWISSKLRLSIVRQNCYFYISIGSLSLSIKYKV